ncbi:MAG: crossover junction endodeoxyribonuclease RuvC [Flavobacteriales bacterium]|nr:crossover junction endodeoxyribonuclease RuvC [Flavobacteriales bacterium]
MAHPKQSTKEKIILGIDPGTNVMGFGILKVTGQHLEMLSMGSVQMKDPDYGLKLKRIFEKVLELIDQFHPDEFAVEAPFFGKNVQSMLKLGRAQGVSMAAALYRDIPISEYSPRKIKQSITGTGAASKEQVAGMLQSILKIETLPKSLDATDGLAVALCHYYQSTSVVAKSGSKDWSSFIAKNPGRVK